MRGTLAHAGTESGEKRPAHLGHALAIGLGKAAGRRCRRSKRSGNDRRRKQHSTHWRGAGKEGVRRRGCGGGGEAAGVRQLGIGGMSVRVCVWTHRFALCKLALI